VRERYDRKSKGRRKEGGREGERERGREGERERERNRGKERARGSAQRGNLRWDFDALYSANPIAPVCFMRECYLPAAAYNGIDLANAALYVLRRVRPRRKNLVPIAHMYVVHSGCIQI